MLIKLIFHYPIWHINPNKSLEEHYILYSSVIYPVGDLLASPNFGICGTTQILVFTTVIGVRSDGSLKISANADEYRS